MVKISQRVRVWAVVVAAAAVLAGAPAVAPADVAPADMLARAVNWQKGIKDYTATVLVETNIPGVDMPQRKAKVYVKPPDKVHVESKGIVMIPKRALLFGDLAREIKKNTKALHVSTSTAKGRTIHCLKLVPVEENGDRPKDEPRILVWIDGKRWTVEQVKILAGDKTLVSVKFSYVKTGGFWMPQKVACLIPKGTLGSEKAGRLSVAFDDYKVNTGLTDEFFQRKGRGKR